MICPMCYGKGTTSLPYISNGLVRHTQILCDTCDGTGAIKEVKRRVRVVKEKRYGNSYRTAV